MTGRRHFAALAGILGLVPSARAVAQQADSGRIHTLSIRADNDAFDFWQSPPERPDEDYSSGVQVIYDNGWSPWWAKHIWLGTRQCVGATPNCRTSREWIGQDMYTQERNADYSLKTVGERPAAGWLYYGEELRRIGQSDAQLLDLTYGVTGPPSLAQYTQEFAHSLSPHYDRPIDWSHQLAFEPGFIATYEVDKLLTLLAVGPMAVQAIPSAAATAGNVFTRASGKLETRLGLDLPNPWLPIVNSEQPEIIASGAITGFAVARDLFLDGNTFRGGPRVGHEPVYLEREAGITVSYRRVSLGYRAVFDEKTYATGHAHAWGSLTGGFAIGR